MLCIAQSKAVIMRAVENTVLFIMHSDFLLQGISLWFARPDRVNTEPHYELPLPVTKLISTFEWVLNPCRLSRAGLRCLRCHDICAGAHFVPPMLSATSAIVSLIALIFRAFGSTMHRFSRIWKGHRRAILFAVVCAAGQD